MKKIILVLCFTLLIPSAAFAFQPQSACSYLKNVNGLSTGGYKSDGMGGYYCCSPYKMIDGKSNIAYYVEGLSNSKANKVYLVLNVYNSSNKAKMHASLLSAARLLTKQATAQNLNSKIANSIINGKSASIKQGKYLFEVKRENWPTGLGYELHFAIK